MKKLLLLFSALIMLFSCSSEEENIENPTTNQPPIGQTPGTPSAETFSVTAESTTVLPFKVVLLSSNNQEFSNSTYDAKFGEIDITLVRIPEGDLIFTIPDVESGNYSFKLVINGKEGNIEFKVNSSQIVDANAVVKLELEEPLEILKQDIEAMIVAGGITGSTIDQLNSAKLMYSDFTEKYKDISNDEKMDIAQFFKANPIFSNYIIDENRASEKSSSNNGFSCFKENAAMLAGSTAVLKDWEKVALVIEGTDAEEIEGAGVGAFVGGYLAASTVLASQERLITTCTRPVSSSLIDTEGNADNFELTNDEFKSFLVKTGMRTLKASDIDDYNETVSQTVENINQITGNWEKTRTSLNNVTTNSSSWFNEWLSGNNSFKTFSSLQSLSGSATESLVEGNNEFVSITGLPSDVSATVEKNETGKLNIKFNASENAMPRDLTGKIVYDDGLFRVENDFKVILSAAAYNYKLEIGYYNLDQTITTVKILSQDDEITLPNNLNQFIRLTLNGEPVQGTSNFPGWWYNWSGFGDHNQTPVNSEDIYIENYEIDLPDVTNNRTVYFKIDLTLSNQALRHLFENEYKFTEYNNGILGAPLKIVYKPGGIMEITNLQDGLIYTRPYEFFLGHFSHEEQCLDSVFKTPVIGALRTGGIHPGFGFTYILEDGSLRTNVMPYGCYDADSGYLFEKMD